MPRQREARQGRPPLFIGEVARSAGGVDRQTSNSLPCCDPVLPPAGNFCHERQKSPKTPVETNGFHPSFARLWLFGIGFAYIANRNAVTSGRKCRIVPTPLSAAAFALKRRSRHFYRRRDERLSGKRRSAACGRYSEALSRQRPGLRPRTAGVKPAGATVIVPKNKFDLISPQGGETLRGLSQTQRGSLYTPQASSLSCHHVLLCSAEYSASV